jgi:uncharacterized OB-fold protein
MDSPLGGFLDFHEGVTRVKGGPTMSGTAVQSWRLRVRDDVPPAPKPFRHPETEGFWQGLEERWLRLQRCSDCGTIRFPLAACCFNCLGLDFSWQEICPQGAVAAVVEVQRSPRSAEWAAAVPFVSGLVDMEVGIRLPGRILCSCGVAREQGTSVEAVVVPAAGKTRLYAFAHACDV